MLSLHTNSLKKYGLSRIFEFAKAAGYDGIEIGVDKNSYDTQNAEYIKRLSQEHGLPIVALHSPKNGTAKSVEHVVEMAAYLKCPVVVITPPKLLDFKFTNWLKKQVPIMRKKKHIHIALVNAPGKTLLGFLPERALNSLTDMKKFGMAALDCSSAASKKWGNLMTVYDSLKKLVVHVHLSNINKHKEYSAPNQGILPIESFLKKLKSNDYSGAISIRIRPTELSAGDDEKVLQRLKKIKAFVDEFYK